MQKIQPGYRIIHNKFGEGVVTSAEDILLEVNFPSARHVKLRSSWVMSNCKILTPKDVAEEYFSQIVRLNTVMKKITEKSFQKVISAFHKFSLSERGLKEIEDFFRFKFNYYGGHNRILRYNLLIQCDNDDEAQSFLKEIESGLKALGILDKKVIIKTESEVRDNLPDGFPRAISMLGIHDCEPLMKDSVSIVSSSIRGDLQLKKSKKDLFWSTIMKCSKLDSDCAVIAVGPKGFIDYIRESDELYYRFFSHIIIINPLSIDRIISATKRGIYLENLTATKPFEEALERYIRVVYPKADLKDTAFVDDLLNRIFVNYYVSPSNKLLTEKHIPFYRRPKTFDEISEQLNRLVGLSEVKKQFRNIYLLSQDSHNINKHRLHFAFVGNPGTGKTTVARLSAELLFSMGLIKRNKLVVIAPTDIMSVYVGESAQLMQEKINEAMGGVLFIDEAYFLTSKTTDKGSREKQCLEVLLQAMENHSDELTVIFAGYENEIDEMLKSNPGLASRVPYRFVFEDYTDNELLQIFLDLAAQEGMSLDIDAYDMMLERIALAKTEENFGNARTIANIYQQLKVVWLNRNHAERIITTEDIRVCMPVALNADLNKMIGLASVKKELQDFEYRVRYIRFLKEKNVTVPAPNMHMLFTGNPGTGKTTVAHKIADCLYQIGILKSNKLIVAERKDLVSQYVGGTAQKTGEIIGKAMNGVLFIDEAYSLYRPDDSKDTGTEAITTLITAMEKYKDSLIIIFAGYKKEMQVFQSANPGIASRIGFTFHFPDYSPDELTEMFSLKLQKSGFVVEPLALSKVKTLMEYFSQMDDFGNGRFVDKVIDATINKRSKRRYAKKYNDINTADIPEIRELIRITGNSHILWTDEEQSEEMRLRIAVHEAGHAVVSMFCNVPRKVNSISINADAGSQGKTAIEYNDDSMTESALKATLAIQFGGRNAERLILGDHSAGCASDVSGAKRLAQHMIDNLAVGELGVTTSMDLLKEADQTASTILKQHVSDIKEIAHILVKMGTISGEELEKVIDTQMYKA